MKNLTKKRKEIRRPLSNRQARKALARARKQTFIPIMGELDQSGICHKVRKRLMSPKRRGEVNWRKKQWLYGMRKHPKLNRRRFRKLAAGRVSAV